MAARTKRQVVVAGASGFVGHAAARQFAASGWDVIGLSRNKPFADIPGATFLPIDLRDADACRTLAASLPDATHLVYAAVNETPGDLVASWSDPRHAERNGAMFANLLDALIDHAPGLEQVTVVHGTKAYGPHVPGWHIPVPLKESHARPPIDDFYFRQEDHLRARASKTLRWTVFRCPSIAGGGPGGNLNAFLAIGVFAAIRRAEGLNLPFPGAADNHGIMEVIDVDLLARAIEWAAMAPTARNATFNIANGDVYAWPDMWPHLARIFGITPAGHDPMSVRGYIQNRGAIWADIVRQHSLRASEDVMAFLGESGALADFLLGNCQRTMLTSTVRLRQAGFTDCMDTEERMAYWIGRWREQGLLPPAE